MYTNIGSSSPKDTKVLSRTSGAPSDSKGDAGTHVRMFFFMTSLWSFHSSPSVSVSQGSSSIHGFIVLAQGTNCKSLGRAQTPGRFLCFGSHVLGGRKPVYVLHKCEFCVYKYNIGLHKFNTQTENTKCLVL